jgi:hypothetical protein
MIFIQGSLFVKGCKSISFLLFQSVSKNYGLSVQDFDGLVKSLHPHNGLKTNGIQDESA